MCLFLVGCVNPEGDKKVKVNPLHVFDIEGVGKCWYPGTSFYQIQKGLIFL